MFENDILLRGKQSDKSEKDSQWVRIGYTQPSGDQDRKERLLMSSARREENFFFFFFFTKSCFVLFTMEVLQRQVVERTSMKTEWEEARRLKYCRNWFEARQSNSVRSQEKSVWICLPGEEFGPEQLSWTNAERARKAWKWLLAPYQRK